MSRAHGQGARVDDRARRRELVGLVNRFADHWGAAVAHMSRVGLWLAFPTSFSQSEIVQKALELSYAIRDVSGAMRAYRAILKARSAPAAVEHQGAGAEPSSANAVSDLGDIDPRDYGLADPPDCGCADAEPTRAPESVERSGAEEWRVWGNPPEPERDPWIARAFRRAYQRAGEDNRPRPAQRSDAEELRARSRDDDDLGDSYHARDCHPFKAAIESAWFAAGVRVSIILASSGSTEQARIRRRGLVRILYIRENPADAGTFFALVLEGSGAFNKQVSDSFEIRLFSPRGNHLWSDVSQYGQIYISRRVVEQLRDAYSFCYGVLGQTAPAFDSVDTTATDNLADTIQQMITTHIVTAQPQSGFFPSGEHNPFAYPLRIELGVVSWVAVCGPHRICVRAPQTLSTIRPVNDAARFTLAMLLEMREAFSPLIAPPNFGDANAPADEANASTVNADDDFARSHQPAGQDPDPNM